MSRSVDIGDRVIVKVGEYTKVYKIIDIIPEGILITGNRLLVPPDWKIKGYDVDHSIEFTQPELTGLIDTDEEIILRLPYQDIRNMCQVYPLTCHRELLWKKLVERDFPDSLQYQEGSYRDWYESLHIYTDFDEDPSIQIRNNRFGLLKYLHSKGMHVSKEDANTAIMYGHLDILKWLISLGIFPDDLGISYAVRFKRLDILKYLSTIMQLPSFIVTTAVDVGDLEILKWAYDKGYEINKFHADTAMERGYLNVLIWLKDKGILPTGRTLQDAEWRGYKNVVEFWNSLQ
jgi:hypothetical protein